MNLSELVDDWCRQALRRLHKQIDRRCEYAKGERSIETVNQSTGQRYRDRDAEAREAGLRG